MEKQVDHIKQISPKMQFAFGILVWSLIALPTQTWRKDFLQDYFGLKAFLDGHSLYSDSVSQLMLSAVNLQIGNYHPPALFLFVFPLILFPYFSAYLIISAILVFAYVRQVATLIGDSDFSINIKNETFLMLILWTPFLTGIQHANVSSFVGIGSIFIWYLFKARKVYVAGITLAIISVFKLFPLYLCGFFLIKREFKLTLTAILSFTLLQFAAICTFGWTDFSNYYQNIAPETARLWGASRANISFSGMVGSLFLGEDAIFPSIFAPQSIQLFVLALVLLFTFLLICFSWRLKKDNSCDLLLYGLWCCGMILASPISWQYILVAILLPLAALQKLYLQRMEKFNLCLLIVFFAATYLANYDAPARFGINNLGIGELLIYTKLQPLGFLGITLMLALEILKRARALESINRRNITSF